MFFTTDNIKLINLSGRFRNLSEYCLPLQGEEYAFFSYNLNTQLSPGLAGESILSAPIGRGRPHFYVKQYFQKMGFLTPQAG